MNDRYASVHIDMDPSSAAEAARPVSERRAFHLLLLGDFSARRPRGERRDATDLPPPRPVDRDDFDAVLAGLAPRIRLTLDTDLPPMEIVARELDDLHPDGLFARAPLFTRLRDLRRRVLDPREIGRVAMELGQDAPPDAQPRPVSGGALLDLVVAETAPPSPGLTVEAVLGSPGELSPLVRALVKPHLVPRADPRQADLLRSIDAAIASGMRAILHHPEFQATESLWRSLFLLVRGVETGTELKIDLLDVTADELDDLLARPGWAPPSSAADVSPALLVALHPVVPDDAGIERLRRLARAAAGISAACLTGIPPQLVGIPGIDALDEPREWEAPAPEWDALRHDPAARHLAAALPRFLLRLPYGEDSDECESFAFEELDDAPAPADFLWGSPAIASAILLARAFSDHGWMMRAGSRSELDGLPLPILRAGGEISARQTAEAPLHDGAAEALMERGVIPFVAVRDRGVVRVPRFQSVADPLAPLAGPWSST